MTEPTTWTLALTEPVEYRCAYSEIATAKSDNPVIMIELPLPKGTYRVTVIIEKEPT